MRNKLRERFEKLIDLFLSTCIECDAPTSHYHHLLTKHHGGKTTVPLCNECHGKIHDMKFASSDLIKSAIKNRQALNLPHGKPRSTTDRQEIEIWALYEMGFTPTNIAHMMRLSFNSVKYILYEKGEAKNENVKHGSSGKWSDSED